MRDFSLRERWQPDGACWTQAALEAGSCAHVLRDKRQLALAFTNCHLQESGRPLAPPPDAMSDATFAIYTEFFTHTSDLCFHLQGEHHQQRAHDALAQLAGHAHSWLHLVEALRAVATYLAGALAIALVGKAAHLLQVPHATKGIHAAQAAHLVLHALGAEVVLTLLLLAGVHWNS